MRAGIPGGLPDQVRQGGNAVTTEVLSDTLEGVGSFVGVEGLGGLLTFTAEVPRETADALRTRRSLPGREQYKIDAAHPFQGAPHVSFGVCRPIPLPREASLTGTKRAGHTASRSLINSLCGEYLPSLAPDRRMAPP